MQVKQHQQQSVEQSKHLRAITKSSISSRNHREWCSEVNSNDSSSTRLLEANMHESTQVSSSNKSPVVKMENGVEKQSVATLTVVAAGQLYQQSHHGGDLREPAGPAAQRTSHASPVAPDSSASEPVV